MMKDKLEQVAIRMVEEPPLYSEVPMNSPEAAVRVMQEFLSTMDRELFCVVNLQTDIKPINMNIVSIGALNQTLAEPREIFKSAILSNSAGILLFHNHPSGNLVPSKADIRITNRIQQAGKILGIQVFDHIITGRTKEFYSFREQGILFGEEPLYAETVGQLAEEWWMTAEQGVVKEMLDVSYRLGEQIMPTTDKLELLKENSMDRYQVEPAKESQAYTVWDKEGNCPAAFGKTELTFQDYREAEEMAAYLNAGKRSAESMSSSFQELMRQSDGQAEYKIPAGEMPAAYRQLLMEECTVSGIPGMERLIRFDIPGYDAVIRGNDLQEYFQESSIQIKDRRWKQPSARKEQQPTIPRL